VLSPIARLLRLASVAICLLAVASFGLFAINQTGSASAHQQRELNGETTSTSTPAAEHEGGVRRTIDDAANAVTSPFSSAVSHSNSEWTQRLVKLGLALLVGFALAFLARMIRMRV
jgi:hypothetical protein